MTLLIAKVTCSKGPVSHASAQCAGDMEVIAERPGALARYFTIIT